MGREADALALFHALASEPHQHDFFHVLRQLECLYPEKPRWGEALRPVDEPVRLGQEPDLAFPPSSLSAFEPPHDGRPGRLFVRLFGLLGPNGPLPLHFTEHARDRWRNAGDPTTSRFLDVLQHRFIAQFYRAWAQAQPHVNRDRVDDDHFRIYVGAFAGLAHPTLRNRDSVPDTAKLFHVAALIRQVRNADGLAEILRNFFTVPVRIEEFVGHWMALGSSERTFLGRDGAELGRGAVLGGRIWDRQHKFRVVLGPLTLAQYERFLPGGRPLRQLVDWVRFYLGFELDWDVQLRLASTQVPALRLGRAGRLGWTAWLGTRPGAGAAGDLSLHAESFVAAPGVAVP